MQHPDFFRRISFSGKMCPTFRNFYRSGTLRDALKTLGDALEWSGNIPKRQEMSGNVRTCPKMSENCPKTSENSLKTDSDPDPDPDLDPDPGPDPDPELYNYIII